MVEYARKVAARRDIESAKYFMQGWRELPPLPTRPAASLRSLPTANRPDWCGDPDCDEKSRMRQSEDSNGLRSLRPCQQCHPNRKETAA
jgi:hypothetical protein